MTVRSITVEYTDAIYKHTRTIEQEGFVWARVKSHYERYGLSILNYPDTAVPASIMGIPSVMQRIQINGEQPVEMTKDLQWWSFELMLKNAPQDMQDEYKTCVQLRGDVTNTRIYKCWFHTFNSTVAFTNKTGVDGLWAPCSNHIAGINLDLPGWRMQPTISHLHTVKVLRTFKKANTMQAAIEIANAKDPKTLSLTREKDFHIVMCAVNWSRGQTGKKPNGTPILTPGYPQGFAEPFPKLDGRNVYVGMLGNGVTESYIDCEWLQFLTPGTQLPFNPYFTPKVG